MRMALIVLCALAALAALLALAGWLYTLHPKFGRAPEGERLARILASPNFSPEAGMFVNLEPGDSLPKITSVAKNGGEDRGTGAGSAKFSWWEFFFPKKGFMIPAGPLPSEKTDLKALDPREDVLVWLGHSSVYLQLDGFKILIDPVFTRYASPIPFVVGRFAGTDVYGPDDIPDGIDVMIISHDHWDHLDYDAVKALRPKIKKVVTALGVGAHLAYWGYPEDMICDPDWYGECAPAPGLAVGVLPARHFSGRLFERNRTLWASFAFVTPNRRVYYTGDTGYGSGRVFAEIGEKYGGFDLVIIEDGQYNLNWHAIHMLPDEVADAAEKLRAAAILPVHNSAYPLSPHRWSEPLEELYRASEGRSYRLLTPLIGAPVRFENPAERCEKWWEDDAKRREDAR